MEQVAKEPGGSSGGPLLVVRPIGARVPQDGLEWAWRWLPWGGGARLSWGTGALALLLRFRWQYLASAKGPAEIRLLGRSTEHPAVVHQLCAALNALAPDHVSCTPSLQLPKLPPEPTTVLSVRVESGGVAAHPRSRRSGPLRADPDSEDGGGADGGADHGRVCCSQGKPRDAPGGAEA